MKSYTNCIGDGRSVAFDVKHDLDTMCPIVQLWQGKGTEERRLVTADVLASTPNTLHVMFANPPKAEDITVVVAKVA